MAKLDTLKEEFRGCKSVFPYQKLARLLKGLGYEEVKGASGSRRKFVHKEDKHLILLHKPHPGNEVKSYKVREIQDLLLQRKQL